MEEKTSKKPSSSEKEVGTIQTALDVRRYIMYVLDYKVYLHGYQRTLNIQSRYNLLWKQVRNTVPLLNTHTHFSIIMLLLGKVQEKEHIEGDSGGHLSQWHSRFLFRRLFGQTDTQPPVHNQRVGVCKLHTNKWSLAWIATSSTSWHPL